MRWRHWWFGWREPEPKSPTVYIIDRMQRRPVWHAEVRVYDTSGSFVRREVQRPVRTMPWWHWTDNGESAPANLDRMLDLRKERIEGERDD